MRHRERGHGDQLRRRGGRLTLTLALALTLALTRTRTRTRTLTLSPNQADADGTILDPDRIPQLCDRIIVDDARVKLRMLTTNKRKTGQPWMLAVGLRKPHLPYRFPKPYLDMLPPLSETDVAQHWRLDASVPAIAHASGWLALALTRTLTPTLILAQAEYEAAANFLAAQAELGLGSG